MICHTSPPHISPVVAKSHRCVPPSVLHQTRSISKASKSKIVLIKHLPPWGSLHSQYIEQNLVSHRTNGESALRKRDRPVGSLSTSSVVVIYDESCTNDLPAPSRRSVSRWRLPNTGQQPVARPLGIFGVAGQFAAQRLVLQGRPYDD